MQYLESAKPVETDVVVDILKIGVNIHQVDRWGWPSLFYAAQNETTPLKIYKILIDELKADVNFTDNWGRNLLSHYFQYN